MKRKEHEIYLVCHTCKTFERVGTLVVDEYYDEVLKMNTWEIPVDAYDYIDPRFLDRIYEHRDHDISIILVPPKSLDELKKKGYSRPRVGDDKKLREMFKKAIREAWRDV